MKNKIIFGILLFTAAFVLSGGAPGQQVLAAGKPKKDAQVKREFEMTLSVPAPSLMGNLIGEPLEQKIYVRLPKRYYSAGKRYPVMYYLPGFRNNQVQISGFLGIVDEQTLDGMEFILVGVNGKNKLGGSFWVNSPVTGNWENFLIRDVVGYIDANFKTLARPGSRGIAGFSMGGFAAVNIGLRHPEAFSCLYAGAPGLFAKGDGLEKALGSWKYDDELLAAYGAAFAPDVNAPFPHARIPKFNGPENNQPILESWEKGYGDVENKVDNYRMKPDKLSAILIEYGAQDEFPWIPEGCRYFSKVLTEKQIPHQLVCFEGTHDISDRMAIILNFFKANLKKANLKKEK